MDNLIEVLKKKIIVNNSRGEDLSFMIIDNIDGTKYSGIKIDPHKDYILMSRFNGTTMCFENKYDYVEENLTSILINIFTLLDNWLIIQVFVNGCLTNNLGAQCILKYYRDNYTDICANFRFIIQDGKYKNKRLKFVAWCGDYCKFIDDPYQGDEYLMTIFTNVLLSEI